MMRTLKDALALMSVAFVIAATALSSPAWADDTALGGTGGGVFPIQSADIRLAEETVQAVLFNNFAEYRVEFHFVNDGPAQDVLLGFPFAVTAGVAGPEGPVSAFRAWQDGRPLEVTLGKSVRKGDEAADRGQPGYFLHRGSFPPGPSTVTVTYLAERAASAGSRFWELTPPAYKDVSGWDSWYTYWLHTGATWKGPIGKAVVRYVLSDSFFGWGVDLTQADAPPVGYAGSLTAPAGWAKPNPRTYEWAFSDFEPTPAPAAAGPEVRSTSPYDIVLAFTGPNGPYGLPPIPETADAVSKVSASSSLVPANATPPGRDAYAPWRAADGSPSTAWAEGKPGPGLGETLQFTFIGDGPVREVRIVPGSNETLTSFREHSRPKTLRLTFASGASTFLHLKDEPGLQRFPVAGAEGGTGGRANLEIVDVYPGSADDTTYISEVEFGREPAPEFEPFAELILAPDTPAPSTAPAAADPSTTVATMATTGAATTAASVPSKKPAAPNGSSWRTGVALLGAAFAAAVVVGLVTWARRRG
jgi:hypothetical protein